MDFRHSDNPTPFSNIDKKKVTPPTWKQVGDLYEENQNLHYENALKLTQILDLEMTIWNLRNPSWNDDDGSPCWCGNWEHTSACEEARKSTEPFWKK